MNPTIARLMAAKQSVGSIPADALPAAVAIAQRQQALASLPADMNDYADMRRIVSIPVYGGLTDEEYEHYCKENILADLYKEGFRFHREQADALSAYEFCGGLVASMGVGWGKTLLTLAIAQKAWLKGLRRILLMIPPQVVPQFVQRDIKWARRRVPISFPIHVLAERSQGERKAMVDRGTPGLYVWTYSLLSAPDADYILSTLKPELIESDEAHNLAQFSAARTRRMRHYVEKHNPEFVALSGSITSKSIKDYYHLIVWSLKEGCPLPLAGSLANEWGAVIDAVASREESKTPRSGPLKPLITWARRAFPNETTLDDTLAGFRRAYQLRLTSVPGVVSTGDAAISTSLVVCNRPVKDYQQSPGWDLLDKLGKDVSEAYLTPNGDEIEHQIHCWKWLNEIYGAGFYNELTWPLPPKLAERKGYSEGQALDYIEKAKVHHMAGQEYARKLRKWLQNHSKPKLDTPFLVGGDFLRNKGINVGDDDLYQAWLAHRECHFPECPERDSRAVRVCPYKIDAAIEWCRKVLPKGEGALLWVYHQEIGVWLFDELVKAGFDRAMHAPAGHESNSAIIKPECADRIVVASITAHGTGKNLQHFSNQYFVEWPRSATIAEQAIGRTHRNGQKADSLDVYTNVTVEFDKLCFSACLNDALYVHQTTGNHQKLIIAAYNPMPKIYPSMFLYERGLQNKQLTREQQNMLNEKFAT